MHNSISYVNMATLLERLPPEVYACVLDQLTPYDVLQLRRTCHVIFNLSEDYAAAKRRALKCALEPTYTACCTLAILEKYGEWDVLKDRTTPVTSEDLLHAGKSSAPYLALIIPGLLLPFVVQRQENRKQLDLTDLQTLRIAFIQYRDIWKFTGQRYIEYQEGGLGIVRGSSIRDHGEYRTLKVVKGVSSKKLDVSSFDIPSYYTAQSVALRFNPGFNRQGGLILLHSNTQHNTDGNMFSHLFWHEYSSGRLLTILTIIHVPEPGSIVREAYIWNNKMFLFCENYFMEAEIFGAKGTRLVVDNVAGTYHTDIAASQDHAVSPSDTQVRCICEGKVLLGDYRVLDLDKQTVSHREPWVSKDKQGFYEDMPVRYGKGRFAVG